MLCAVCIHIPHKTDALLCTATRVIIIVGDIIDPVQAGIISDAFSPVAFTVPVNELPFRE